MEQTSTKSSNPSIRISKGILGPGLRAALGDPLSGDISTRKPVTERVDTMLKELMRAHRKQAGSAAASSSSSDDSEDEERVFFFTKELRSLAPSRMARLPAEDRDPLRGPPVVCPAVPGDPAVQAMPFSEFVLWDIAGANPDIRLPAR